MRHARMPCAHADLSYDLSYLRLLAGAGCGARGCGGLLGCLRGLLLVVGVLARAEIIAGGFDHGHVGEIHGGDAVAASCGCVFAWCVSVRTLAMCGWISVGCGRVDQQQGVEQNTQIYVRPASSVSISASILSAMLAAQCSPSPSRGRKLASFQSRHSTALN